ncbi:putative arginine N-succinyltransferase [Trichinella spiralis]|uniref:putative arginine N-succinyltransferase n=1 Tax=Trichinella spiralis TaxID=6334 RepID=UPI0001EFE282|nr:putative arginine N-succinyltransferase [Trichinella spiralis]
MRIGHCEWAQEGLAGGGIRSSKMVYIYVYGVEDVQPYCAVSGKVKMKDYVIAAELFWSLFRSGPVVHHAHQFDLNVALQTLISIAFAADCSSVRKVCTFYLSMTALHYCHQAITFLLIAHSVEGDVVTSFSGPSVVSSIIRFC